MKKDVFTLTRIAKLYYVDKIKQNVIAKKFNITPMMVSRYLREAEKIGLVEIKVKMPWKSDLQLGKKIKDKYDLNECIVLDLEEGQDISLMLGRYLAEHFISILPDDAIIGVSWGRTIGKFSESLPFANVSGCEVFPLSGTFVNKSYVVTPTGIMQSVAHKLNAQVYAVNAPLYTSNEKMKKQLMQDSSTQIALEKAEKSDINIIGIGDLTEQNLMFELGILSHQDLEELKSRNVIGDVAGTYIDANGNPVQWSKSNCYTGITLDGIKKAKEVFCVAGGVEKARLIKVAAKKRYFKTLITEKKLAMQLI